MHHFLLPRLGCTVLFGYSLLGPYINGFRLLGTSIVRGLEQIYSCHLFDSSTLGFRLLPQLFSSLLNPLWRGYRYWSLHSQIELWSESSNRIISHLLGRVTQAQFIFCRLGSAQPLGWRPQGFLPRYFLKLKRNSK